MSLVRPTRKRSHGLVLHRVVIVCVAALSILLARSASSSFQHIPLSLTVSSHADHDHRQCFDHEDSQWATAASTLLSTPPLASVQLTRTAEPFVEIVTDGLHYNRPPPIS